MELKNETSILDISIGTPITGATAKYILYTDNLGQLAQNVIGLMGYMDDINHRVGWGTSAPSSRIHTVATSIGTTIANAITAGHFLENTTAATSGAQQFSPALRWRGAGWETAGGGTSKPIDWIAHIQPISSSSARGGLLFRSQINNTGYTTRMELWSDGFVSFGVGGPFTAGQALLQVGGGINFNGVLHLNGAAGLSGQSLLSSGGGLPTWGSPSVSMSNGSGTTGGTNQVHWVGTLSQETDINAADSYHIRFHNIGNHPSGISWDISENFTPTTIWHIHGSWGLKYKLVDNDDYEVLYHDSVISIKTDSASSAVTFPDAALFTERLITIKFYDSTALNDITITPSAGNIQSPVDYSFGASYTMIAADILAGIGSITWISNGTDWEIAWTG